MGEDKMIHVGLIGLGGIMRGVHAPGIKSSGAFEIAAVCDINREALDKFGEAYNIPPERRFTDYRDLIACPAVEAVDIGTPNDVHVPIALAAVAAGKPFSCEKPVALNAPDAIRLADAARAAGLPSMVCFSYRYVPAARFARDLVRKGDLGEIQHVAIQYMQGWGLADVACPLRWRFIKARSGSGALGDLGSHAIDLVSFITGLGYRQVVSQCATVVKERPLTEDPSRTGPVDVDDYANFMAEMQGGASCCFQITRLAFARGNYQRLEIYGTRGALVYMLDADGNNRGTIDICIGNAMRQSRAFVRTEIPACYTVSQMSAYADILKKRGDGLSATIDDGAVNMKVMDAVLASQTSGQWVPVQ